MYRRRLLAKVGVGGIAVGSGCSGLLEARRSSSLEGVTVRNEDGVAREFALTIGRNDSVVHETTVKLARSEFRDGDQHKPLSSVACEWSGRGPFVVTCALGNGQTEAVRGDEDVEQGGGAHAEVTVMATDTAGLDWSGYPNGGGSSVVAHRATEGSDGLDCRSDSDCVREACVYPNLPVM